ITTAKLQQLNEQLTAAEADRIVKEARHKLAATGNPELIATIVPNTTLQVLRTQEADLKAQYAQLTMKFGSGYPKVREVQGQLDKLERHSGRGQERGPAHRGRVSSCPAYGR